MAPTTVPPLPLQAVESSASQARTCALLTGGKTDLEVRMARELAACGIIGVTRSPAR